MVGGWWRWVVWWRLAVDGWPWAAVGGWRLVVGGYWFLGAVLTKCPYQKKKFLRTALLGSRAVLSAGQYTTGLRYAWANGAPADRELMQSTGQPLLAHRGPLSVYHPPPLVRVATWRRLTDHCHRREHAQGSGGVQRNSTKGGRRHVLQA